MFFRTRLFSTICLMAVLSPGLSSAIAAESDWKPEPRNLAGLDGIGIRCVVSSDRKFVHQMCDILIEAAVEKAAQKKLKAASAGISWQRNPDDAYRSAVASQGMQKPLMLEFFIRGTDGDPVSGAIHILASVEYQAAVERGGDPEPRSGRLVIWENAGTGSGPVKQLGAALGAHMANKLDLLFGAF